jgi:hypothetical protein
LLTHNHKDFAALGVRAVIAVDIAVDIGGLHLQAVLIRLDLHVLLVPSAGSAAGCRQSRRKARRSVTRGRTSASSRSGGGPDGPPPDLFPGSLELLV